MAAPMTACVNASLVSMPGSPCKSNYWDSLAFPLCCSLCLCASVVCLLSHPHRSRDLGRLLFHLVQDVRHHLVGRDVLRLGLEVQDDAVPQRRQRHPADILEADVVAALQQ